MFSNAKIDWERFNFNFSGNQREAFQQLCEQLFCYEFNRPFGIHRFYNHPHIETEPVVSGEECIGFQSKYYDTGTYLGNRKDEIIKAIIGAKEKYPQLTKIILYVNKEPGASSRNGKAPRYLTEIEVAGKKAGVNVEWFGLNRLETMLIKPELEYIRDYFFSDDKGIRTFINQLCSHKNDILNSIHTHISYEGKDIEVPIDGIDFDSFINSGNNMLFVSGKSGTGKSALIKRLVTEHVQFPFLVFRATDFSYSFLSEVARKFGDLTWQTVLDAYKEEKYKICILDSAEKALSMEASEAFWAIVRLLRENGWRIIFTIRDDSLDEFCGRINCDSNNSIIKTEPITVEQLKELSDLHGFLLPREQKYRSFIRNLFYLKLYLSDRAFSTVGSIAEFESAIWDRYICGSSEYPEIKCIKRGNAIINMARTIIDNGTYYLQSSSCEDIDSMGSLKQSGIISYNNSMRSYFFSHDIIEEIVAKRIIQEAYMSKQSDHDFFASIGNSTYMRKIYRIWLEQQIESNLQIYTFVSSCLFDDLIEKCWKDDTIITIFNGNSVEYNGVVEKVLARDNYGSLFECMKLLRIACKSKDMRLLNNVTQMSDGVSRDIYRYTSPYGSGWSLLISFAYNSREQIPWMQQGIITTIEVLYDWTIANREGESTKAAGQLGLYLFDMIGKKRLSLSKTEKNALFSSILLASTEIKPELEMLFDEALSAFPYTRSNASELIDHMLQNSFYSDTVCKAMPRKVIELLKHAWLFGEKKAPWQSHCDIDDFGFGLNTHVRSLYDTKSAYVTPIYSLLQIVPLETIDFVCELFDIVTENYRNSRFGKEECCEIEIHLDDECNWKQIASSRLWGMYRGNETAPHLLESTLMALEKWLYETIRVLSEDEAEAFCRKIIMKSHSAAITAVIVSMIEAYPQKISRLATVMTGDMRIVYFDNIRCTKEFSSNIMLGLLFRNKLYLDERKQANSMEYRKIRLVDIAVSYQINEYGFAPEKSTEVKNGLYKAFDKNHSMGNELSVDEQLLLSQMDLRKNSVELIEANDKKYFVLKPNLSEKLRECVEKRKEFSESSTKFTRLFLWCSERIYKSDKSGQYPEYDNDPDEAVRIARKAVAEGNWPLMTEEFVFKLSALIVLEFERVVSRETFLFCANSVLACAKKLDHFGFTMSEQDISYIARAIANLAASENEENEVAVSARTLILEMLLKYAGIHNCAASAIRQHIWGGNCSVANRLFNAFLELKPLYDHDVKGFMDSRASSAFFETNEKHITELMGKNTEIDYNRINDLSYTAQQTLVTMLPIKSSAQVINTIMITGRSIWPILFGENSHSSKRGDLEDYSQELLYIRWIAQWLITVPKDEKHRVIIELKRHISANDSFASLLDEFFTYALKTGRNDDFWIVWNELFDCVKNGCMPIKSRAEQGTYEYNKKHYFSDLDNSIYTYLFAWRYWGENEHSCVLLSKENSFFFERTTREIGFYPSVFGAIARMLSSVGYVFENEGVKWLSIIISNNDHIKEASLPDNTLYDLEEYIHRYIDNHQQDIKQTPEIKRCVDNILGFLVNRGSTKAYMLREGI